MKKRNSSPFIGRLRLLFLTVFAVFFFCSCAAVPQMRMSVPDDSSSYAGSSVYLHELLDSKNDSSKMDSTSGASTLSPLFVSDSLRYEYKIGPRDIVQVVVWEHPELTNPMGEYQQSGQTVSPDGTLFYPYAGEIQAAGLTTDSLRKEITTRLSNKILTNPQVDVKVVGYNSLRAFVFGSVVHPGFVAFNDIPMTLPEALNRVGGFASDADVSSIMLRRAGTIYTIDYLNAFSTGVPLDRILLQPGDQLWVPSMDDQNVYVLGEVGTAGSLHIRNGHMSLMEAVANAGGLQVATASASSLYVIRNTAKNRIDVYHLNAKNAMAFALADQFPLKSRDIVYVDASGLATWNRIISQILPTAQTIYYGLLTRELVHNWVNE